mmetsp:Transcript_43049/g.101107  ORF Transcript_43049/g.101107 Transcript_43049/m.101107 type:complete len:211 (+) Transcript_43049:169-801(+)
MQSLDNRTVQQLKDVVAAAELPKAPPSMSNNAAHVRQELAKDPHNLDLLLSLGEAYTRDGHWNQACNVLHRGWSRLAEVEAGEKRFSYAAAFCESSFRSGRVDVARDALPKLDLAAAAAAVARASSSAAAASGAASPSSAAAAAGGASGASPSAAAAAAAGGAAGASAVTAGAASSAAAGASPSAAAVAAGAAAGASSSGCWTVVAVLAA